MKKAGALEAKFHDARGLATMQGATSTSLSCRNAALRSRSEQSDRRCRETGGAQMALLKLQPHLTLQIHTTTRSGIYEANATREAWTSAPAKLNFRIGERLLEKFGPSVGRKTCDAEIQGAEARAARSDERRARMEQAMCEDELRRTSSRRGTHGNTAQRRVRATAASS